MTSTRILLALIAATAMAAAQPRSSATIFSSHELIHLRLQAPFDDLFLHADQKTDYRVAGTLSYFDESGRQVRVGDVEISERGHTSRNEGECDFPKLKLRLTSAAGRRDLFDGVKHIKLGTHCGERSDDTVTAKYGRIGNERAPHREAFVYRLLEVVQAPSLKARPARITYTFTDRPEGDSSRELVRDAMVLEDTDDAVKRLGGARELDPGAFISAQKDFSTADTAVLAFAEALIGNFDWCLKFYADDRYRCDTRHPLWNVTAAVRADGPAIPIIYDFDLAGMVTGPHLWFNDVFNEAFVPSLSRTETEVVAQVQRARSLFARPDLDQVRSRFQQHKDEAFRALEASPLDPAGRRQIKDYLQSFYNSIDDARFYIPVVTRPNTKAFADGGGRQQICGSRGAVPVGTPVGKPLNTAGPLAHALLLDVMWHWAPPDRCDAAHRSPVWIDRAAIDSSYP